MPGPLFSFAAFLGAASDTGAPGWIAGLIGLIAIFLPGLLLVLAVLPHWHSVQRNPRAAGLIRGASAAVVGVLAAALWRPVLTSAITGWPDAVIALAGFVLLQVFRAPAWLVVILVGGAGALAA
jgi:chromate transporter